MTRQTLWRGPAAILPAVALLAATLASPAVSGEKAARININTATAAELESLPRIGPEVARRIIEYREKNGPFKRPADLLNVRGIGDKVFEQLKDRITVSETGEN